MFPISVRGVVATALLCVVTGRVQADSPLADARRLEAALQGAIARAEPAVVCVLVRKDRGADPARRAVDLEDRANLPDVFGSGVVIDPQGLVLTHYHVVRDAARILVRLPGRKNAGGNEEVPRELYATVFAADNRGDLAVLKLSGAGAANPVVELGAGEKLEKGSMVVALAHPHASGFRDGSASASWGIISNLRRRLPGSPIESERSRVLTNLGVLLQTDARLQIGSSGGALIDLDGKLVGLTTAQAAMTGVDSPGGFAIPIDANYRRIIDVLVRGEEVEYGFLGVSTANDPARDRPRDGGVFISDVTRNSPADRAGLGRSDRILQVNGQPVREYDDMFLFLGAALAGRRTELVVQGFRDPVPRTIEVVLAKFPVDSDRAFGKASVRPGDVHGLRVDYTSVIAKTGDPMADGVVIREVLPNSPAKSANLTEYVDIITRVNDVPVNNPADFYRQADKAAKAGDKVKLTLRNPSRTISLP